ncbi:MAG TPA: NTP transferase domain-containing protein [Chryseosolibacter sp.]|nr:NTP transferase domain-containing protein [Chryseosolibacter sp.]
MKGHSANADGAPTDHTQVNGLILTGGHSTRMGTDKSMLVYHDVPQREHLFRLLANYCTSVFISCRNDQDVPKELNPIRDSFHIQSPLNGILSAFQYKPDVAWLAVAVDMPFVDAHAIERLLRHRDRSSVATCYFNTQRQHPEPLLTVWESIAYPLLLKFAESGNVSPREFLQTHGARLIEPPDEKTLINVNHPGDLH